ncbi:MAG TPA: YhdP family protein [Gammaproteobacteria bacterium]
MSLLIKLFHGFWYVVWYLFAAFVVLLAAIFAIARLLLPLAGDYNQDVESYAAQLIGRPVKIMSLDAEWHGMSPSLVLNNVRLLSRDGNSTILQLSRARLDFDLVGMAFSRQVRFKRFALAGADLSVVREPSGTINLSGFETSQPEPGGDDSTAAMLQWLLAQGEINVHARNLVYQDMEKSGQRYLFSNVSFVLKNRNSRHLIDGTFGFPQHSGQEFAFALDIAGDVISGTDWSGRMYVSGTNLEISRIFGGLRSQGHLVNIGKANFQLWSEWREAALVGVQGDLSLETVKWQYDKQFTPLFHSLLGKNRDTTQDGKAGTRGDSGSIEYDNIVGRFTWGRSDEGWQLIGDKFVLARNSRIWPTTQFAVHYLSDQARKRAGSRQLDIRANLIRLEDITPLVPVLIGDYQDYAAYLAKLAPQGDIHNTNFRWSETEADFKLAARLENTGFASIGKVPGLKGLSGELRSNRLSGSLVLKTEGAEFSLPDMFRADIPLQRLTGRVDWRVDNERITLSSRDLELVTPHVESKAVMDVDIPRNGDSPFLSLIINFENGDGSKASDYYPVAIMKPETVRWLDAAIVQGDIVSGGAIIYGPLKQFPFTEGQGVFETRFEVKNAVLDYAEEWPQIHDLHATVLFNANSLLITSEQAKIFNSSISNARVSIPALAGKPLELDVEGVISGQTQEKINYLVAAPQLHQRVGQHLSDLKAGGESTLDLKLNLQLKPQFAADVSGKLSLQDNSLQMSDLPDLLTGINGELLITHEGLTATAVKAAVLGQPAKLTVKTVTDKNKPAIKTITVRAAGDADAKQLAGKYMPVLTDLVEGKSRCVVELVLPADREVTKKRNVELKLSSSLEGVQLNLPPPFSKQKPDSRRLRVAMSIKGAGKAQLKTSYADEFEGIFEFDRNRPNWVTRGEARFGGGAAVLPGVDGLRIAGKLRELSLDIWMNLLKQTSGPEVSAEPAADTAAAPVQTRLPYSALLNAIDLEVGKFEFLGQTAANLKLLVNRQEGWLDVTMDSKEIKGTIRVPEILDTQYVSMDLQHLHIKTKEQGGGKIDPREMPAIKFNGRNVSYDNKQLGQVAFETARTDNGLLLQQLVINPTQTLLKGFGEWVIKDGQHQSTFEFVLESTDLGATMKDLGYVETIDKGKGEVIAKLEWPAPLFDPDLAHISGNVELDFKNGRILDIEPGSAARVFGLFSIQTLPKRLFLDFRDLFAKGLGFDSIRGNFKLEDGDAYTSNFKLTGSSADVALKGRIGLGAQDYDQKIKVTPHITDAAVLLSILTAQPLLLVLQQLLKQDIDGAASVEYTLTGSWANYALTPVLKEKSVWDEPQEY